MTHWEFFVFLYSYWYYYFLALAIAGLLCYLIGRRYTNNWLDPLRIALVFVAFANAVPIFLLFINKIYLKDFIYFLIAESSFWIGFIILARKEIKFSSKKILDDKNISFKIFIIFLVLYIVCIGSIYALRGIPLLMKSRLDLFKDSGGLAVLMRITALPQIFCLLFSFYLWENSANNKLRRYIAVLSFSIFILTGLLSGSKGNFLYILYAFWGYKRFYKEEPLLGKNYYKIFIPALLAGIFTLVIQTQDTLLHGFLNFFNRFIFTGDLYWMAYPNQIYKHVVITDWFANFFQGFLGPMRLIDYSQAGIILGFQMTWLVYPYMKGISVGPNSRPVLLGYIYFGWWGILFSFLLGLFVSIITFRSASLFPKGLITSSINTYIYISMIGFITDPITGFTNIFDVLLNLLILIFILFFSMLFLKKINI